MLKLAVGIVLVLYPFLIYLGLAHFEARYLGLVLVAVALIRFFFGEKRNAEARVFLGVALVASMISIGLDNELGVLLYPALVSTSFLAIFASSLFFPPTAVERIARLQDKEFPDEAIPYTRKVTIVWCVFFLLNALVSLLSVFIYREFWLIYNGFVSYVLMASLFACEYFIRIKIKSNKNV